MVRRESRRSQAQRPHTRRSVKGKKFKAGKRNIPNKKKKLKRFFVSKEIIPQYFVIDRKQKSSVEQLNEKFEADNLAKKLNKHGLSELF